jgi:hypothetical protein
VEAVAASLLLEGLLVTSIRDMTRELGNRTDGLHHELLMNSL